MAPYGVPEMKSKTALLVLCLLVILLAVGGCKVLNKEKKAADEAEQGRLLSPRDSDASIQFGEHKGLRRTAHAFKCA